MEFKQVHVKSKAMVGTELTPLREMNPDLVMVFGSVAQFTNPGFGAAIREIAPGAITIGCTTAGEISARGVFDDSVVITAAKFRKPSFKAAQAAIEGMDHSLSCGENLGKKLAAPDLHSVFVLGQGVNINGSELIQGIQKQVGKSVTITGGLAGDGGKFLKTYTLLNGEVSSDQVVAFGVYGTDVQVSFGSMGGWQPFGPVRRVTKSAKNVLFELDGQPALEIYKSYLGEHAKQLPASGLLFPFAILKENSDTSGLIRTILAVDEKAGSLTFAGDIPQDGWLRLMHTDTKGLVCGAENAAKTTMETVKLSAKKGMGVLISCVGRKLVLGGETDEEVDAVREVFGKDTTMTGFYSYGEICPLFESPDCKLHNQTMTITYFTET